MPHRCGLMHVRGTLPVAKITPAEVGEHQKMCEERLAPLLNPLETRMIEDASKLGKKPPRVETFLSANSVELSKDKWLCPSKLCENISSNKHAAEGGCCRQEVGVFNNYLLAEPRGQPPLRNKPLPPVGAHPGGGDCVYHHTGTCHLCGRSLLAVFIPCHRSTGDQHAPEPSVCLYRGGVSSECLEFLLILLNTAVCVCGCVCTGDTHTHTLNF
uniref:SERRATE/Ars2 C-terminal domain-containing protein n=1 Tax=Takifugu rubripes TaxID=31033 RepID=A0A674MDX5_TAKRU